MHRQNAGAYDQLRVHVTNYALSEVRRSNAIHGDCYSAAQHAAKEGPDPFCAVITPQQHAVTLAYPSSFQFSGKRNASSAS